MPSILLWLALFTLTASAIQVSLLRHWWEKTIPLILIGIALWLAWPWAITIGAVEVLAWLTDPRAMLDVSVVLILEAFTMVLLAALMVRDIYQPLTGAIRYVLWLQFLPAATCLGVLVYYLVHVYQMALPYEFETIALGYAGSIILALALAGFGVHWLIPSRVLRMELKLAMHAAQIALGVATSVLTSRYPYRSSEIEPNLLEFVVVLMIIFVGALAGLWRYRRQMSKLHS
jgi:hypothetical protein